MSTSSAVAVTEPEPSPGGRKARSTWPIYLLAAVVAGLVGGVIGFSFVGDSLAALGIPDPGPVTTFGLPFFRAVGWMLAALSIGSFMFSAFYISPHVPDNDNTRLADAGLTVDGHLAGRTGAVSAVLFGLVGLLMVPLVLSDVSGTPLGRVLNPSSFAVAVDQVATSQVWAISAGIALVIGLAGMFLQSWSSQPVLLLGAILMIVPLGMEGHAATGGAHDYGTNAYLWHLIFMAVWIGGLMALIAHGRRLGPDMRLAVARYSAVALFAIVVVALSGVVSAVIRIQPEHLFTTRYGLIIVAKIVGTIILGLLGFAHRQVTIPSLGRRPGAFLRLAVGEVVVMAGVVGIAITMGRTPPPPPADPNLSSMAIQMGYELTRAPTFFNVFTMWRFDILWGVIAVLLAALYLWGVRRIRRDGKEWEARRTVHWLLGCASLLLTTSSGIGMNMPASYSMHMVGHMLLSMVVPLFLALGGPLSLLMTAWDSGRPGQPNIHDWAHALTRSRWLRIITIPWLNLLQFIFFFYVLYVYIPLYELAISEHAGHVIMNSVFLLSGYFYFWELVGPDPIPGRKPIQIRLAWLVVSMPVHLFMGVYLMQLNVVMGEEFYNSLELPWNPDLLADQKVGGGVAWAFGSFPLTYVMVLMFLAWRAKDKEDEERVDAELDAAVKRREARKAAPVEDAEDEPVDELDAYNEMLRRYSSGEGDALRDYYGREFKRK